MWMCKKHPWPHCASIGLSGSAGFPGRKRGLRQAICRGDESEHRPALHSQRYPPGWWMEELSRWTVAARVGLNVRSPYRKLLPLLGRCERRQDYQHQLWTGAFNPRNTERKGAFGKEVRRGVPMWISSFRLSDITGQSLPILGRLG